MNTPEASTKFSGKRKSYCAVEQRRQHSVDSPDQQSPSPPGQAWPGERSALCPGERSAEHDQASAPHSVFSACGTQTHAMPRASSCDLRSLLTDELETTLVSNHLRVFFYPDSWGFNVNPFFPHIVIRVVSTPVDKAYHSLFQMVPESGF